MEIAENLKQRYISVHNILEELQESMRIISCDLVGKTYYKHMRNSEIRNFKFSIDILWKFFKEYLLWAHKVNVEIPTPKKVFRDCLTAKIISQEELEILLDAVDARNKTSHTYHEELAEEIAQQIPQFYQTMHAILQRVSID